jgi:hypothetical protein
MWHNFNNICWNYEPKYNLKNYCMSLVYKQFILILFESRNQINTKLLYILAETLIDDMDKKQIAYVWYGFIMIEKENNIDRSPYSNISKFVTIFLLKFFYTLFLCYMSWIYISIWIQEHAHLYI